jgi:hypothetical protein
MKRLILSIAMFSVLLLACGTLSAHHGEANYDTSKVVSVTGTVTEVRFINPHALISLDVKSNKGEIEKWLGEAQSPANLVRNGWNINTIKVGDTISLTGHRPKNGANVLRLYKIVLPDGHELTGL